MGVCECLGGCAYMCRWVGGRVFDLFSPWRLVYRCRGVSVRVGVSAWACALGLLPPRGSIGSL